MEDTDTWRTEVFEFSKASVNVTDELYTTL